MIRYVHRDEYLNLLKEYDLKLDKRIDEIMDYIDNKLSSFIKGEIEFFRKTVSLTVALYGFLDDFNEINTVEDYFKIFDEATDEQLFNYIGVAFLSEYYKDDNTKWKSVKDDLRLMKEYIESIKDIKKGLKKDIVSLYDSPKETRMRLRYIINTFYDIYKNFEEELNIKVVEETELAEKRLNKDTSLFYRENLLDSIGLLENKEVIICISYIRNVGCRYCGMGNKIYICIGYNSRELYKVKELNEHLDKFLKLISDKTRQKILALLSEKPRCTHSLARELGLTPATVNYHLQNFLIIGLVTIMEEGNKAYYKLDKEVANKYIDKLRSKLNLL